MTTSDLKFYKDQILYFFSKNPKETYKPKELARRLSIKSEEEFQTFLKVFHELCDSDEIS